MKSMAKRKKRKKHRKRSSSNQALKLVGDTAQLAIGATAAVSIAQITASALKK